MIAFLILLVLILLICGAFGFTLHLLWWVALAALILIVIALFVR